MIHKRLAMNKKQLFIASIFLIINVFVIIPSCQSSEGLTKSQFEGFDDNIKQLPKGYFGLDPKELFKHLEKISKKGEFQTSSEYKAMLRKPFFGGLSLKSLMAVSVDIGYDFKYDADNKKLTLTVTPNGSFSFSAYGYYYLPRIHASFKILSIGNGFISDNGFPAPIESSGFFELLANKEYQDSHEGKTVFGIHRTVKTSIYETYNLYAKNRNNIKEIRFRFSMPVSKAKLFKKSTSNMRVLIIFTASKPYTGTSIHVHNPTFDEPEEIWARRSFILAYVKAVWLYNVKTGEIYQKKKIR